MGVGDERLFLYFEQQWAIEQGCHASSGQEVVLGRVTEDRGKRKRGHSFGRRTWYSTMVARKEDKVLFCPSEREGESVCLAAVDED